MGVTRKHRFPVSILLLILSAAWLSGLSAAEVRDPLTMKDPDWVDGRFGKVQHGQFLHYSFAIPNHKTPKGIAIKVGDKGDATVCFDTLLVTYAGAWTGGFLELSSRRFGFTGDAKPKGDIAYSNKLTPGWSKGNNFGDPRKSKTVPLPRDWAHYKGLYQSGKKITLHYTVGGVKVLDHPWLESHGNISALTRELEIAPSKTELRFMVASQSKSRTSSFQQKGTRSVQLEQGKKLIAVSVSGGKAIATASGKEAIIVRVPAHDKPVQVKVFIWDGNRQQLPLFAEFVKKNSKPQSLAVLTKGGKAQWTKPITTKGRVGLPMGPIAIDTITLPFKNPYDALFFAGGHDFFSNGNAALGTAHGDVWVVKGLDDKLQNISWKRFATGLYQPLGLKIIKDKVFVLSKDQITELTDLNNDGEADYYRNFNNDNEISGGGHNYATCLETDPEGNFWFIRCNDNTPHGGTLLKVARDGSSIEVMATGFRNPNGMGVSPKGVVTTADQQGNWVPETRLDVIKKGGFYGFVPSSKRKEQPKSFDGPLCWIPRVLDNSAGGQTWVPKGKWGPLSEQMIHLSYGRCTIMAVLLDEANKGAQGGIISLPGRYESGVHRGRFNPKDGHLYLSGLKGWQTVGLADGCFQRARFTGRGLFIPTAFSLHRNGLRLTFNETLKKDLAEDPGSFHAEIWNYLWSKEYGSKDYSVADASKEGRDQLVIKSARLEKDGKTVFLEIPALRKASQLALRYNLTTDKGAKKKDTFYTTINQLAAPIVLK